MRLSLERYVKAWQRALRVAGSPVAILSTVVSSLANRGVRQTWESILRFRPSENSNLDSLDSFELFQSDQSFIEIWQVQAALSPELAKSRPKARVGQNIFVVRESVCGRWVRDFLPNLINFNPEIIFLMEDVSLGGNERFTEALVAGLTRSKSDVRVLVVRTSGEGKFEQLSERLAEVTLNNLSDLQKATLLEVLLKTLNVKAMVVANSRIGWQFLSEANLERFGAVKFYAHLYCQDFDDLGREIGFGKSHFPNVAEKLTAVISDNKSYPQGLISEGLKLEPSKSPKIQVFSIPTRFESTLELEDLERNDIVWIGRLVKQKGFSRARKIAIKWTDFDFHFFGHGSGPRAWRFVRSLPSNAFYHGTFSTLEDLKAFKGLIYLNTSLWDGLPNTLIEMVSAGLPVITSELAGISEFKEKNPTLPIFLLGPPDSDNFAEAVFQAKAWLRLNQEQRNYELKAFLQGRLLEMETQVSDFIKGVRVD